MSAGLKYGDADPRSRAAADFRQWKRTLGRPCYFYDVDGIEARPSPDGSLAPALVWEFTTVKEPADLASPAYVELILARLRDNGQLAFLQRQADATGAPLVVIIADYSLQQFNLVHPKSGRTRRMSRSELAEWFRHLPLPRRAA